MTEESQTQYLARTTVPEVVAPALESECRFCKEQIIPGAIKCKHCGSDLSVPAETDDAKRRRINNVLRGYRNRVECHCLECGYEGLMGLIKQIKPLCQQGWLLLLVFCGIGIPLFLCSLLFGKPPRNIIQCPACLKTLTQTGSKQQVFMVFGR
jgi:hypothetical protein